MIVFTVIGMICVAAALCFGIWVVVIEVQDWLGRRKRPQPGKRRWYE